MDRIKLLESGFLYLETPEAPMHVAGLNLFKLPKGVRQQSFMAKLADAYRSGAELRQPFGHRVAQGMLGRFGPMYWEEDPDLDLDFDLDARHLFDQIDAKFYFVYLNQLARYGLHE